MFRGPANPMLRRFGRGLGPWYGGLGAQRPASDAGSAVASPVSANSSSSEPFLDVNKADHTLGPYCWPGHCFAGHCWLDQDSHGQWVTNGYCWAVVPPTCRASASGLCAAGQQGIRPGFGFCGGLGEVEIDYARPCTVHF
jgi:hypothetical protein